MNWKYIMVTAGLWALCVITAPAQRYNNVIDKTVAQVGTSVILLSDVEAEVKNRQNYGYAADRCATLEEMLMIKLLYTQAMMDSLTVNPDMINASLNERLAYELSVRGGESGVEAYYGKPLYRLREQWRKQIEEQALASEMRRTVAGKIGDLTPRDVESYYKNTSQDSLPMVPTQYYYSQILLYPDRERAELEARETLLEFRQRILDGERFSFLATLYSEDGSAFNGGELGMTSKDLYYPAFSDAAMPLKPGQVSQIVKTPDGFHLIQMIEKQGDMFNARHILIRPKYTAEDRIQAFARLDSIRTAIVTDSITFEQAARIYSEDAQSRTNGGMVSSAQTGAPYFEVDQLKPADYAVLRTLKEGEISAPMESTDNEGRLGNTVYKLLRLDKIRPAHTANFNEDFDLLLDRATTEKSMRAVEEFIAEKQKTTYIVIDPLFHHCVFLREGWLQ